MSHTQDKSSALSQGVVVFVYLAILTALEFFVAVTFNAVSILVVVAASRPPWSCIITCTYIN